MKTSNLMKLAVPILMLVASSASALSIVGSKHDLNGTIPGNGDDGRVCAYCHAPHNGSTAIPLWNRTASGASYTMYNNTTSASIDMAVDGAPSGTSSACLSCHDGTVGLDSLVSTNLPTGWTVIDTKMATGAGGYLGIDLSNDHPISITYNNSLDTAFNAIASGKVGTLPLFSDKVQCATCHAVHDNAIPPFLRLANTDSALRTTCHTK